ncbi:MAG: hypothetical protein JWR53_738, partial [Glaciihabitans sp.]|nr:hypothetical protein [Glaciihabitans sp.]
TVVTGIGLATQFTSPGAVILACLLVGVLVARPAGRQLRTIPRRAGVVVAAAWALVLAIGAGSGIALQQAVQVSATDIAAADGLFAQAQSARPWDGDLPSIAAESFAAAASDKVPGAGPAAVRWAQRSLALAPDTQASLVALGVGQQASGDLDAARLSFARAYDRNRSNEQALSYLGIVEATQQDYTAARDHLLIASRLLPTDARAWTGLAYVYQQLGDKASADAAHARAVAVTPG